MKKILFLVLFLFAFAQVQAPSLLADPGATTLGTGLASTTDAGALAAREADLLSRIHGAKSHRGMLVNDVANLQNVQLKPFRLSSGEYMLKPVDGATQRILSPESMRHPSVKAYMRDVGARRFTTLDQATASAPAHKGWLTRTAGELERSLRGRQGGLQNQLNRVRTQQAEAATPPANQPSTRSGSGSRGTQTPVEPVVAEAPKPATTSGSGAKPAGTGSGAKPAGTESGAKPAGAGSGAPKPVVEGGSPVTASTGTGSGSGSGAPKPVVDATSTAGVRTGSGTNVAAASEVVPPASTGTVRGSGAGAPPPLEGPTATNATGNGANAPAATGAGAPPAAPTTMMGRARAAMSNGFKGTVKSLPVIVATSLAVDLANQYRRNGTIDVGSAVQNMMTSDFLSTMAGGMVGGIMGQVVGNVLPAALPFGRFIKAGLIMGGAAMGANLGGGQEIDWKRLAFTTAITAAVSLAVPGGFLGAALLGGTGFGADVLYDYLFGKKEAPRAEITPVAGTGNGTGSGSSGNGTGAGSTQPAAPPSGAPQQQAQTPVTPPPSSSVQPPLPPDKGPSYADLPVSR